ncbi:hypothetical protein [Klebsiella pneumoniae]|uniref:hypothetical protein n=2 Tax=Enterobacteriaceae TaxID=543 RepID=UPI00388D6E8A
MAMMLAIKPKKENTMKNATEAAHDGPDTSGTENTSQDLRQREQEEVNAAIRYEQRQKLHRKWRRTPTTTMSGMLTKGRTMATCRTTARMKNMNVRVTWNYRSMSTKIINMIMTRRATAYDVLEPK